MCFGRKDVSGIWKEDLRSVRMFSEKKVFFEMLNLCKIGMGEYPQGELVIPVNSGTISFSSKAEKSLKCEFLYIVTCNTSTHYYM